MAFISLQRCFPAAHQIVIDYLWSVNIDDHIYNENSWAVWTTVLRPVNQRGPGSLCMCTHTLSCCSCSLHTVMWVKPEGLRRVVRLQSRLCSDSDVQSPKPLLPSGPLLSHRSPLTVLAYVRCCSLWTRVSCCVVTLSVTICIWIVIFHPLFHKLIVESNIGL